MGGGQSLGWLLLMVRRIAIFGILFLAYLYYRLAGDAHLVSIGCCHFAAIAQLAPAFFIGLSGARQCPRRDGGHDHRHCDLGYTLMLPSFADAGIVGTTI